MTIFILVLILLVLVFFIVMILKSNSKLKKELKTVKETVVKIQEKEKEYAEIKESFNDSSSGVSSTIDFLHNHERNKN